MAITSSSYMSEEGDAVIVLYNDHAFATSSWSAIPFYENLRTYYSLFRDPVHGVGELSNSDTTLTITVSNPASFLELTVGSFEKVYSFEYAVSSEKKGVLAYFNDVDFLNSSVTNVRNAPAFVLFNAFKRLSEVKVGSCYRASLVVGSEVVGYAFGEYSHDAWNGSSDYSLGAIVFGRVLWVNKPAESELNFMVSLNGTNYSYKISWNGSEFTGPIDSVYSGSGVNFVFDSMDPYTNVTRR